MRRLTGFGGVYTADAYVMRPMTDEDVAACLAATRARGRQVVMRGMGRSYGDAAIAPERIALDLSGMQAIRWADAEAGVVEVEAGVSLTDLWRWALPQGWWPPVVSGTSFVSIGGALAMNVHGKNAWRVGPLGEHVTRLDVMLANGEVRSLKPEGDDFWAVISGAGLLGVILRAWIRLRRVLGGELEVEAISCSGWDDQFTAFERFQADADYMVSWVDCFARGTAVGRGLFHAAWYADGTSLDPDAQLPQGRLFGVIPRHQVWRTLALVNRRPMMRSLNALKHLAGRRETGGRRRQTLGAFSFLLDAVPDWRRAYGPAGFVQFQSFVPADQACATFSAQVRMQQEAGLESYLAVLKRHRRDRFVLSHGVDGYSLALDFPARDRQRVWELCGRLADVALAAGGRFYLAKDATLRAEQYAASLGPAREAFLARRADLDPDRLFTSSLAWRLGLDG